MDFVSNDINNTNCVYKIFVVKYLSKVNFKNKTKRFSTSAI